MWLLLNIAAAQAQPLVEVADFSTPRPVTGLVARSGPPGCAVHFEYEDPSAGWTRFRHGVSLPSTGGFEDPYLFMPPHDEGPPLPGGFCANVDTDEWMSWSAAMIWHTSAVPWRIVDGDGEVLTSFSRPYAVDARPLALALDALDDYQRGKSEPGCLTRANSECWTAFELWVYLEDWTATHCVTGEEPDL